MSDGTIGRTFGDFVVRERLGAGGAGAVYLAEQLALGRQAVIKVMAKQTAGSAAAQERFLREARLASRLDHPFAAHVYAFGAETDGTLWIAMELVRGTPLDKLVASQGAVSIARFVPLFERLCEVLNAAHEQDIVHRDIKPANVMVLQRAGKLLPKLLDLGIARTAGLSGEAPLLDADFAPLGHITSTATPISSSGADSSDGPSVDPSTMSGSLAGRLTRSESMHLTQIGSVVGTPHYMAPEQWADASRVGAKADIYSLAILAFQCLSGRVPFKSKSLMGMAKAHASQPLPPLPEDLPEALHRVLSKGAAKRPEDRFSTCLEFAAAVRGASGLGVEPVALPQLEEGLRENVLSEAPQPLAEAVSLLEGARTSRQAVEGVSTLVRALCRYLGILAMAARVRVGSGGTGDALEVSRLVIKLRDSGLSDAEWLELGKQLTANFRSKFDAHPLPELVRYFSDDGAKTLTELAASDSPSRESSEEAAVQYLVTTVPRLGSALERASFLFDYHLVVQATVPERWMGTRRARRLTQHVASPLARGDVVVVDAVGSVVVTLPPLLQCIAPSGGAPEEMFLLEGPGRHGAKLVALPSPFERQDESLWQWMVEQGLLPEATGAAVATEKVPYKGLSTFGSDDADNYFGREKEAEAFANRMRKESFLAVVGPSGTGKSSFILAGVLPLLPKGWKPVVMRPGATPALPNEASEDFGEGHLVLVVDQFEELVTLCQNSARRNSFATQLVELSRHPSGRVRVVVTLRDDFLIKVQQLPAFRETLSNSLQLLGTPAPEDLQRVVTEPARRVGYAFDDAQLPKRMVEAVSEYPGALALLSFTASQLWELRDRHLRLMRVKTYDALGGVGGALANHAEATLASLNDEEQKLVREVFRHLVTAQGTRAVLTKKEALEVLGATPAASTVLEKLVTARLLVSSETADGNDSIEVIHEALITAWPRLVGWQREDAESARLRDSLRASARQWEDRGRASGLLWRKETLTEYRVWRARFPGRLTQLEESFAAASIRDEARAQLIRRSLAIAAFLALSVGLIVIFSAYRQADANAELASRRAAETVQRMAEMRLEQSRLALLDGRPFEAMRYLQAGQEIGLDGNAQRGLSRAIGSRLSGQLGAAYLQNARRLVGARGPHVVAALDPHGEVTLLSAPELSLLARVPADDSHRASVGFLTDREAVICQGRGSIWRWTQGVEPRLLIDLRRPVQACAVSSSQRILEILHPGGELTLLHIAPDGAPTAQQTMRLRMSFLDLSSSPDGRHVVAFHLPAGTAGVQSVEVIDPVQQISLASLPTSETEDVSVAFDSKSSQVAIGSWDGKVRIFAVPSGAAVRQLEVHGSRVTSVFFSPDGELLTSGLDGNALVVDSAGKTVRRLAHGSPVEWAQFVRGGIVTTAANGAISYWREGESQPDVYLGHLSSVSIVALDDGTILSAGIEGAIRRWDIEGKRHQLERTYVEGMTVSSVFPKSRLPVIALDDGSIDIQEADSQATSIHVAANPDCTQTTAAAASDGSERMIALGSENVICLFKPDSGWRTTLKGHTAAIARVGISETGRWVISSARDGEVILWNPKSDQPARRLAVPQGVRGVAVSERLDRYYVGLDTGTLKSFRITDGSLDREIHAHDSFIRTVRVIGNQILTASEDRTAAIFDDQLSLRARLSGATESLSWIDLDPSERYALTSSANGTLLVWDAERGLLLYRLDAGDVVNDAWWLQSGWVITGQAYTGRIRRLLIFEEPLERMECLNPIVLGERGFDARKDFTACR